MLIICFSKGYKSISHDLRLTTQNHVYEKVCANICSRSMCIGIADSGLLRPGKKQITGKLEIKRWLHNPQYNRQRFYHG